MKWITENWQLLALLFFIGIVILQKIFENVKKSGKEEIKKKDRATEEEEKTVDTPDKKEINNFERLCRIVYVFIVLAVISAVFASFLQDIVKIVFESLSKVFEVKGDVADGPLMDGVIKDPFKAIGVFVWIVAWLAILVAEILIILKKCWGIILVKPGTIATIEMLKGYSWTAILGTGIKRINCFYYPFEKCRTIEEDEFPEPPYVSIDKKTSYLLDLKVQSIDIPAQNIITKDKTPIMIDGFVYGFIYDSQKAVYVVKHLRKQIVDLSESTLRIAGGDITLAELIAEKGKKIIAGKVKSTLDETVSGFGFNVMEVRLKEVEPSEKMKKKMEELAMSEIEKQTTINVAKGKSKAKILHGAGDAGAVTVVRKAFERRAKSGVNQSHNVIALEYIRNALPKVADGKATKIILPTELSGIASLVSGVVESVKNTVEKEEEIPKNVNSKEEQQEKKPELKKSDKEVK